MHRRTAILLAALAAVATVPTLANAAKVAADPTVVGDLTSLSVGGGFTCGLDSNGTAWCWGQNSTGQLGIGAISTSVSIPTRVDTLLTFIDITAGDDHACAIDASGTAWCWGSDSSGQLGNGDAYTGDQVLPTPVDTSSGAPLTYTSISAGSSFTCAIAADASAWCWGDDYAGKLGNGGSPDLGTVSPSPVDTTGGRPTAYSAISAGGSHTCGIATGDTAWCWGLNELGELGNGSTTAWSVGEASPVAVTTAAELPDTYTQISVGARVTCALATGGTAWCWGDAINGMIGDGVMRLTSLIVPTAVSTVDALPDAYSQIEVGNFHVCGLATDGTAWCWGVNANGVLGSGLASGVTQYAPVAIATTGIIPDTFAGLAAADGSGTHMCAVADDGTGACWGDDGFEQLGNGTPAREPGFHLTAVIPVFAGDVSQSCKRVARTMSTKIVVKITSPAGTGRVYDGLYVMKSDGTTEWLVAKPGTTITVRTSVSGLHPTLRFFPTSGTNAYVGLPAVACG